MEPILALVQVQEKARIVVQQLTESAKRSKVHKQDCQELAASADLAFQQLEKAVRSRQNDPELLKNATRLCYAAQRSRSCVESLGTLTGRLFQRKSVARMLAEERRVLHEILAEQSSWPGCPQYDELAKSRTNTYGGAMSIPDLGTLSRMASTKQQSRPNDWHNDLPRPVEPFMPASPSSTMGSRPALLSRSPSAGPRPTPNSRMSMRRTNPDSVQSPTSSGSLAEYELCDRPFAQRIVRGSDNNAVQKMCFMRGGGGESAAVQLMVALPKHIEIYSAALESFHSDVPLESEDHQMTSSALYEPTVDLITGHRGGQVLVYGRVGIGPAAGGVGSPHGTASATTMAGLPLIIRLSRFPVTALHCVPAIELEATRSGGAKPNAAVNGGPSVTPEASTGGATAGGGTTAATGSDDPSAASAPRATSVDGTAAAVTTVPLAACSMDDVLLFTGDASGKVMALRYSRVQSEVLAAKVFNAAKRGGTSAKPTAPPTSPATASAASPASPASPDAPGPGPEITGLLYRSGYLLVSTSADSMFSVRVNAVGLATMVNANGTATPTGGGLSGGGGVGQEGNTSGMSTEEGDKVPPLAVPPVHISSIRNAASVLRHSASINLLSPTVSAMPSRTGTGSPFARQTTGEITLAMAASNVGGSPTSPATGSAGGAGNPSAGGAAGGGGGGTPDHSMRKGTLQLSTAVVDSFSFSGFGGCTAMVALEWGVPETPSVVSPAASRATGFTSTASRLNAAARSDTGAATPNSVNGFCDHASAMWPCGSALLPTAPSAVSRSGGADGGSRRLVAPRCGSWRMLSAHNNGQLLLWCQVAGKLQLLCAIGDQGPPAIAIYVYPDLGAMVELQSSGHIRVGPVPSSSLAPPINPMGGVPVWRMSQFRLRAHHGRLTAGAALGDSIATGSKAGGVKVWSAADLKSRAMRHGVEFLPIAATNVSCAGPSSAAPAATTAATVSTAGSPTISNRTLANPGYSSQYPNLGGYPRGPGGPGSELGPGPSTSIGPGSHYPSFYHTGSTMGPSSIGGTPPSDPYGGMILPLSGGGVLNQTVPGPHDLTAIASPAGGGGAAESQSVALGPRGIDSPCHSLSPTDSKQTQAAGERPAKGDSTPSNVKSRAQDNTSRPASTQKLPSPSPTQVAVEGMFGVPSRSGADTKREADSSQLPRIPAIGAEDDDAARAGQGHGEAGGGNGGGGNGGGGGGGAEPHRVRPQSPIPLQSPQGHPRPRVNRTDTFSSSVAGAPMSPGAMGPTSPSQLGNMYVPSGNNAAYLPNIPVGAWAHFGSPAPPPPLSYNTLSMMPPVSSLPPAMYSGANSEYRTSDQGGGRSNGGSPFVPGPCMSPRAWHPRRLSTTDDYGPSSQTHFANEPIMEMPPIPVQPPPAPDPNVKSAPAGPAGVNPVVLNCFIPTSELRLIDPVGHGAEGTVWRGRWHHIDVAVKEMHPTSPSFGQLISIAQNLSSEGPRNTEVLVSVVKEVTALIDLGQHPNIIRFVGVCIAPPRIITEYYQRGSLFSMLKEARQGNMRTREKLSWMQRLIMLQDIAAGMAYLHSRNYIHGDLRSPNVFVTEDQRLKIGDFGFARIISNVQDSSQGVPARLTNPRWQAPEVYAMTEPTATTAADVYSFGIIMYEMLTFHQPYDDVADDEMVMCRHTLHPSWRPHMPEDRKLPVPLNIHLAAYKNLMTHCWAEEPAERPAFHKIAERLMALIRWHRVLSYVRQANIRPGNKVRAALTAAPAADMAMSTSPLAACMGAPAGSAEEGPAAGLSPDILDEIRTTLHKPELDLRRLEDLENKVVPAAAGGTGLQTRTSVAATAAPKAAGSAPDGIIGGLTPTATITSTINSTGSVRPPTAAAPGVLPVAIPEPQLESVPTISCRGSRPLMVPLASTSLASPPLASPPLASTPPPPVAAAPPRMTSAASAAPAVLGTGTDGFGMLSPFKAISSLSDDDDEPSLPVPPAAATVATAVAAAALGTVANGSAKPAAAPTDPFAMPSPFNVIGSLDDSDDESGPARLAAPVVAAAEPPVLQTVKPPPPTAAATVTVAATTTVSRVAKEDGGRNGTAAEYPALATVSSLAKPQSPSLPPVANGNGTLRPIVTSVSPSGLSGPTDLRGVPSAVALMAPAPTLESASSLALMPPGAAETSLAVSPSLVRGGVHRAAAPAFSEAAVCCAAPGSSLGPTAQDPFTMKSPFHNVGLDDTDDE